MQSENEFAIGADETGAILLYHFEADGQAVPVSHQTETWHRWVELTENAGFGPGAMIPVELTAHRTFASV